MKQATKDEAEMLRVTLAKVRKLTEEAERLKASIRPGALARIRGKCATSGTYHGSIDLPGGITASANRRHSTVNLERDGAEMLRALGIALGIDPEDAGDLLDSRTETTMTLTLTDSVLEHPAMEALREAFPQLEVSKVSKVSKGFSQRALYELSDSRIMEALEEAGFYKRGAVVIQETDK